MALAPRSLFGDRQIRTTQWRSQLIDIAFETYYKAPMKSYKRNQVEEAISRMFEEQSVNPSSGLRTRIKRLLDADRSLGRSARSDSPALRNYAFFSSDAPGKGVEVLFSDYEAFALLTGLQMLNHGWPQMFAVDTLRRYRRELERRHANILSLQPEILFDETQIRLAAQPGRPALGTTAPVFLLIWSDQKYAKDPAAIAPSAKIFDDEAAAFKICLEKPGRSTTWLELTRSAFTLSRALSKTHPRLRGRS